jgi:AcrR family transcriptional regulator
MKKDDPRFIKSHDSIKNAFWLLMRDKGFQQISATDIIKLADVNRSTFYAHYIDKYDLLDQAEDELFNNLKSITNQNIDSITLSGDIGNSLSDYFKQLINFIYDNKDTFSLLFGPNGDPNFSSRLHTEIKEFRAANGIEIGTSFPENYTQAVILGGMSNLIAEWVKSDFNEPPEKFAEIVKGLLIPLYKEILQ